MSTRQRTKLLALLVGTCLVLVLAALPSPAPAPPPAPKSPIVIGYMNCQTGAGAEMGAPATEGFLAYVRYLNEEKGGIKGHPIKAVVYDTMSDPARGRLVMERLITQDKVHVTMGEQVTGVAIPMGEVAAKLKCVYMANTGSSAFETMMAKAGPEIFAWTFRGPYGNEEVINRPCLHMLKGLGVKRVALLYDSLAFGMSMSGFFKKLAPEYGIEIVVDMNYPGDATVFGPQIKAVKEAKPDAIMFTTAYLVGGLAIASLKEAGITVPMVSYDATVTEPIMKLARIRKAYAMEPGLYISNTGAVCIWGEIAKTNLPEDRELIAKAKEIGPIYERYVGKPVIEMCQLMSVAGLRVLENAIERMLTNNPGILDKDLATIRKVIRDYLETTKDFHSGFSPITISPTEHNGTRVGQTRAAQYKGYIEGKHVWKYLPELSLYK